MHSERGEEVFFSGHPSWLSMPAFLVRWLLASLVLGVAGGLASIIADGRMQTTWVVLTVLAVVLLASGRGQLRRMRVTYRITSRRLTIQTGLFFRQVHEARLERIQNVNCRQSVLQRALGIGTVDFDTAADVPYDFCFRGVDDPRRIVRMVDQALRRDQDDWGAYLADARQ
ncbi:MAG TPA: PH domain-containing protein [Solirubrobacteraceae bacterium]